MFTRRAVVLTALSSCLCVPSAAKAQEAAPKITLEQAIERATARNETWAITRSLIIQSQARQRQVLAQLLPQLFVNARGSRLGSQVEVDGRVIRPQFDWSATGTASLVLFDGTLYPTYQSAGELVAQTQADAAWQQNIVLFEVRRAFVTLAAAQREVALAEQTVAIRRDTLTRASALVTASLAIPLDVARAEASMLEAEQALFNAQAARGDAADALLVLMGEQPGAGALATEEDALARTAAQAQVSVPSSDGLERRFDFVAASRAIEATELSERAVWWQLAPRLSVELNAQAGPPTFTNPDGFIWSVALVMGWVLYDGGARYAEAEVLSQQAEQQRLERQRAMRQARGEIASVVRDFEAARGGMTSATRQVEVAEQALDLARRRFEQGLSSTLEVNDATEALFRAQLLQNQATLRVALANAQYLYLSDQGAPQ